MDTKNIIILIAVVIVAGLALWGISRVSKAPENSANGNNNSNMENSNAQSNSEKEQSTNSSADTNTNTNSQASAATQCVNKFNPAVLKEPKAPTEEFVTFTVKDFGSFKVQLYKTDAPKASENMARLVKAGYYDCLTFHRILDGFVIQGGDPTGTGKGGDSAFGGTFADELNPNTQSFKTGYVKGVLAMANRGPNTNSSQFFITLVDANNALAKSYTIFGKVVSGIEVVDKIGKVEVESNGSGMPLKDVIIEKAVLSAS